MYLVFSHSIPFSDKCEFVAITTLRLMAHAFDIARDILLVTKLSSLIKGASYIILWVSNQKNTYQFKKLHSLSSWALDNWAFDHWTLDIWSFVQPSLSFDLSRNSLLGLYLIFPEITQPLSSLATYLLVFCSNVVKWIITTIELSWARESPP